MPLSVDITLPKDQVPEFPDMCVVCRCPSPAGTCKLTTHTLGWWTWVLWILGTPHSVRVPACRGCAWRLKLRRWGSMLALIGFCSLVLWLFGDRIAQAVPRPFARWAYMGAILLCLIPCYSISAFFPPPVDTTVYSNRVVYEFQDALYAFRFATLNGVADQLNLRELNRAIRGISAEINELVDPDDEI